MKLLLDQGLPRTAAELLRTAGVDALHVGEIGYATAGDATILQIAQDEQRVVVTLDADFHQTSCTFGSYCSVGYSHSNRRLAASSDCQSIAGGTDTVSIGSGARRCGHRSGAAAADPSASIAAP